MSALVRYTAINRLAPYRSLHTDLVAHERYYTFNDPATASPVDMTAWTVGSAASLEVSPGGLDRFDGRDTHMLSATSASPNVYIQSAVSNLDSTLPCTFRVVMRTLLPFPESFSSTTWVRIYDPTDADTDVWFQLDAALQVPSYPDFSDARHVCTATVGSSVGSDVIEARVTNPIPGMTNDAHFSGEEISDYMPGGDAGDSNHFAICEFELPPAASRTMRIQVVSSFGGTSFSSGAPVIIARAEVLQGKVSRWTCRRTGRTFSQPNPALQPYARPMGVPQFNFRRVLYFANGQYLVSDDSADDWAFLCGECSVYAVAMNTADGNGYVLATTQFSPTTDGVNISVDPATDEWTMVVRNADTTQLFDIRAPRFLDTAYVLGYRAQDGHEDGDVVASIGGSQYTANSSD